MSCCGRIQTSPMTNRHRVRVHYSGARTVVITGPVTGSSYRFSGTNRSALLDPRDAVVFAQMRLFRIDGVVEIAAP